YGPVENTLFYEGFLIWERGRGRFYRAFGASGMCGWRWYVYHCDNGGRDCRLLILDFRFQVAHCRLQIADFRLKDFRFQSWPSSNLVRFSICNLKSTI